MPDNAAAAIRYFERGWVPIVVPYGKKSPATEGWQHIKWDSAEAVRHAFTAPGNIGLLLGAPSNGLVDVDLDCPEALTLAPHVLPSTGLVSGREHNPQSHWWYVIDPPAIRTTKFQYVANGTSEKTTLVELRATGGQTVVPPSQHPDGDAYVWHADGDPVAITASDLLCRVAIVAVGALLARCWQAVGVRHDMALPIAGMLYGAGWPQELAETLVSQAARVAGHRNPADRQAVVRDTYTRAARGENIQGVPSLKQFLPAHIVDLLVRWCGMVSPNGISSARVEQERPWEAVKPLPPLLPEVPSLPERLLPPRLRPWLGDIAQRFQVPVEFAAIPALVETAALVGRRCGIYPKKHDDWLVVPNLWGLLVGRPGVLKTPAAEEALRPLKRLVAQTLDAIKQDAFEAASHVLVYQAQREALQASLKQLAKEKKATAEQMEALRQEIVALDMKIQAGAAAEQRYLVSDATVEKLGELLQQNPNGLLLYRDELSGWLRSLDKPGREGDREFYLESWNGTGGYTVDRIGRGTIHIPALCLSILGSIQPGKLLAYVADTLRGGAGDDGLLQRFQLAVWPDMGTWENVDRPPDRQAREKAFTLFKRLAELDAGMVGAVVADDTNIPALRFSEEAQGLFDAWRGALERRLRSGALDSPAFEAHLGKYRSLMPSLALLFHLSSVVLREDAPVPAGVTLEAAQLAAAWCEFLELHARRVYAGALRGDIQAAHALLTRIRQGDIQDGETLRAVYRRQWSLLPTPEAVGGALYVLERHNIVRVIQQETGGRRAEVIRVNPEVVRE